MKSKICKTIFILLAIAFIVPSIMYIINNGTILGFSNYYNFFINDGKDKQISSIIYLAIFLTMTSIYLYFVINTKSFDNIKKVLIYTGIVGLFFVFMVPWTSSDIFYYMGVGELDSNYGQNPYYITIRKYCNENMEKVKNDSIMEQGYKNVWSDTTVVYGPIAQIIFSIITRISFKNINLCLLLFKILNLIVHILNCYLIYKITKKIKFVIIYGLNPFVLLEFMGMVHIDIIVVLFILLSIYFILKKKKILLSVVFLAIATGIKYFTILLLPVIILYHYRNEKNIWKRIFKCIQYGLIYAVIFALEYIVYIRDISIFTAMMAQTSRYCKSLYSGIFGFSMLIERPAFMIGKTMVNMEIIKVQLRNIAFLIFVITYIKFCIDLLFTKEIKFYKILKKYNITLILFLFSLSNFQQWYLVWLFATLPWQSSKTIKVIIGTAIASEVANSVYMFNIESYKYDLFFALIILSTGICIYNLANGNRKLVKIENFLLKKE